MFIPTGAKKPALLQLEGLESLLETQNPEQTVAEHTQQEEFGISSKSEDEILEPPCFSLTREPKSNTRESVSPKESLDTLTKPGKMQSFGVVEFSDRVEDHPEIDKEAACSASILEPETPQQRKENLTPTKEVETDYNLCSPKYSSLSGSLSSELLGLHPMRDIEAVIDIEDFSKERESVQVSLTTFSAQEYTISSHQGSVNLWNRLTLVRD